MKLALHSILCLLLLLIANQTVFSQKRPYLEVYNECGVDLQTPIALRKSPPLELNYDLLNTLPDTIIIPVVVHIVHNNRQENLTNAEVVAMLQQCNRQINMDIEDFDKTPEVFKKLAAKTRIQLRLAKKDPNGKCTDGIVRIDTSLTDIYAQSCNSSGFPIEDGLVRISHWPPEKYLNIYVGRSLRVGNSGPIGIATFPYDYSESGGCKSIDGIYLNHLVGSYSKNTFGTTLSHELGHWLGLYHIWGRSAGISSTSCSDRDFIDDTPNQAGPSNACFDDFPFITCNNGPNGNMFTNFMDYGNCLTQFTQEQVQVMHQVLTRKASGRSELWTPTNVENITKTASPYNFFSGCTNDAPIASFRATSNNGMSPRTNSNKEYLTSDPTDEFFICGDELAIDFSNTSSFNTVGVKWLFEGGEPSTSTLSDPKIKYKKGGEFKVQLIAYNQGRSDTTTQTVKIFDYGDRFYGNQNAKENFESYNHIDEYAWSSSSSGEKGWEISNNGFQGGKSLYLNNNASLNKRAAFRTPMYSLKSIVDAQLVFKVAKARVENNRSVLSINSVSNCYQPTKSLAIFTDGALSVDTLTGYGVFIPQSEHWKTIKIDLPKELLVSEEASFVFTFFGFLQTDIYIDDIEIQSSTLTSVSDLAIKPQLHVYPNPANEELKIDYQSASHGEVNFRLIGIDGRTYSLSGSTKLQGSTQQYSFPIAQLANGVYFVQATQEGHLTTSKVVILR